MAHELVLTETFVSALEQYETQDAERILNKLEDIGEFPDHVLDRLKNHPGYKLRVGDFRVLIEQLCPLDRIQRRHEPPKRALDHGNGANVGPWHAHVGSWGIRCPHRLGNNVDCPRRGGCVSGHGVRLRTPIPGESSADSDGGAVAMSTDIGGTSATEPLYHATTDTVP